MTLTFPVMLITPSSIYLQSPITLIFLKLQVCLGDIKVWMMYNFLLLNFRKTIFFGLEKFRNSIPSNLISLDDISFTPAPLWETMESSLTTYQTDCKSGFLPSLSYLKNQENLFLLRHRKTKTGLLQCWMSK